MMHVVKPGVTERAVAGQMTAAWMENGCERAPMPPIVGSGINSTALHYAEKLAHHAETATSLSSMRPASTPCTPPTSPAPFRSTATSPHASAKFTTSFLARRRRPSTHSSPANPPSTTRYHNDPDSLDTVAYNYINTHGKDLHGEPLGKYCHPRHRPHALASTCTIPADYPAVLKPGMVFTIEPGIYIPEEKIGVRIEDIYYADSDGKLDPTHAIAPTHRRRGRSGDEQEMNQFHLATIERSFLAILAGFATMAVLVTIATSAITKSLPRLIGEPDHPRRRYLLLNLAYSAAFAATGGYVTAIVAMADPLRNILMLAIVILLLSALSALQLRGKQPVAYQLALIVLTPIAALAGGLVHMHAAGYRW